MSEATPGRTAGEISAIMRRVHGRDTTPELAFRRALHARGLRYRVCANDLPGKPDVVFARRRVAIFIDGDFWHGGQWETRGLRRLEQQFTRTETRDYWLRKIRRTMQRDATATASLQAMGWTALRFWETDIRQALDECVEMTVSVLDMPESERRYMPLAEKSVALRTAHQEEWRQGLEQEGWRVASADASHDGHGPAVTLMVGGLGAEREPLDTPLVLLDGGPVTALEGDEGAWLAALLALSACGYLVDAFAGAWDGDEGGGDRRLFVVGTRASARRTPALRERRGAYLTTGEPGDARPPRLAGLIAAHPEVGWRLRALPPTPSSGGGSVASVAWIAAMYLNPLVNELLRGQPLYPAG